MLLFVQSPLAMDMIEGGAYIANVDFKVCKLEPEKQECTTPDVLIKRDDRFELVKIRNGGEYVIKITRTHQTDPEVLNHLYIFKLDKSRAEGAGLEMYARRWDRVIHGMLVVPFKVQFYDGGVTTESATLGYYLGWPRYRTNTEISHGPIFSVGLAGIKTDDSDKSKLGVSASVGYVAEFFKNFQAGIIVGFDHLGDKNWKYDDKGWISVMIGYNFLR